MRAPLLLACLLLGACDLAPPPADPDARLDKAAEHHEAKDAIDAVDGRDEAAKANDAVEAADRQREEELKAAGG